MRTNIFVAILLIVPFLSRSQDSASLYNKVFNLPDKFFGSVNKKSDKLQALMLQSSMKYLDRLEKREKKMQAHLAKKDSAAAKDVFGDVHKRYDDLRGSLSGATGNLPKQYSPHLDSMATALTFLNNHKVLNPSGQVQHQVQSVFTSFNGVQDKLNQEAFIKQQMEARQTYLKDKLQAFGLSKQFQKYKESVYYYRAQMDSYKKTWEDPQKLESSLLQAATKVPLFRTFFNTHSELASVFQLPGSEIGTAAINGLQTRSMIMQELGQQFGSGPSTQQSVSSNITSAQSALQPLKDKLNAFSQGGGDPEMPDFKPNAERTKSFLKRIEVGANIQSTKSNFYFPSTTDIGLSLGYKFSQKTTAGIGMSYKMGWGKDIRHIALSHEGIGLRMFAEMKIKSSFWFSAGGEMNYNSHFKDFAQLHNASGWTRSALVGLSKKYKAGKYQGELKLMYDFLWNRQLPVGQPIVFRTGYTF